MQKKSWRTAVSWQSCWNIKSSSIKYFRDGLINHLFCKKRNAHFFQLRTRILVLILLEGIAFNFKIWGYNLDTKQSVRTWKSQEGSLSRDQASLKKVSLYLRKIRCFEKKYLTKPTHRKNLTSSSSMNPCPRDLQKNLTMPSWTSSPIRPFMEWVLVLLVMITSGNEKPGGIGDPWDSMTGIRFLIAVT